MMSYLCATIAPSSLIEILNEEVFLPGTSGWKLRNPKHEIAFG